MARKKRRLEPITTAATDAGTKEKPRYQDPFQEKVGKVIEETGKKFEGQGRNLLYGLGALLVLAILVGIYFAWSNRSNAEAQTALGKAIETSQAMISDSGPLAGSTDKVFKTERERAEAAIAEFLAVAEKFGGSVGEKARYFAAVSRIAIDREAAAGELEELSKVSGEVGSLSKFAHAQLMTDAGRFDEALATYQQLSEMADPTIAKETIDFEIAKIFEKQGRKQEAVDVLFDLVKTASEVKDLDGKAKPLSGTAQKAKDKLTELDEEKARELPQTPLESPLGGMPFGM
jgi:predicted negative regulator of RcsB-dependent stress response